MTWWGWLLWVLGLAAVGAVLQPWVQGIVLRRGLRAGWATVSVRGATPKLGDVPPRWRLHRATRQDGATVLRPAGVHVTQPGIELRSAAGSGRPLPPREQLRVAVGARHAVPFHSTAGLVEIAARDDVLAWVRAQLLPVEDD